MSQQAPEVGQFYHCVVVVYLCFTMYKLVSIHHGCVREI